MPAGPTIVHRQQTRSSRVEARATRSWSSSCSRPTNGAAGPLGRCVPQLDRRTDGPQRVVLVERLQPEDADDRVADELLDCAAVAFEHRGGDPRVAVEYGVNGLGVELLPEAG